MKDFLQTLVPEISPQVIIGKKGAHLGIFIEMKDYELLLERLEEIALGTLATAIKKSKPSTKPLEEIEKELRKNKAPKKRHQIFSELIHALPNVIP